MRESLCTTRGLISSTSWQGSQTGTCAKRSPPFRTWPRREAPGLSPLRTSASRRCARPAGSDTAPGAGSLQWSRGCRPPSSRDRLVGMASRRGIAVVGVPAAYSSIWGRQHWPAPLWAQHQAERSWVTHPSPASRSAITLRQYQSSSRRSRPRTVGHSHSVVGSVAKARASIAPAWGPSPSHSSRTRGGSGPMVAVTDAGPSVPAPSAAVVAPAHRPLGGGVQHRGSRHPAQGIKDGCPQRVPGPVRRESGGRDPRRP